jgi:parallel beta-helix repeat protein
MKMRENHFWITLPALLLAAGSVLAGSQSVSECGTVITEPGNYKLVNDLLDCEGDGVTIVSSDVKLDLKSHEISCADNGQLIGGVVVEGTEEAAVRNVTVKNGHVSNCVDGIVFIFTEDSKIMHMSSTGNRLLDGGNGTGITVYLSHNNVIMKNHTFGNGSDGINSWLSSGNLFKHNTSNDNVNGFGIYVQTETNSRIMCNRTHGNVDGIWLAGGSGNLLRGNFVSGNIASGIGMMGFLWDGFLWLDMPAGNTIRSNITEDNPWSDVSEILYDWVTGEVLLHPEDTCMNTWEKNQFETELGPTGCFGVPYELEDDDVCALDDED